MIEYDNIRIDDILQKIDIAHLYYNDTALKTFLLYDFL